MKALLSFGIFLLFICCKQKPDDTDEPIRQFTLAQKLSFLDSINNADLQHIRDSLTFGEDSTFNSRIALEHSLPEPLFTQLKKACRKEIMSFELAKQVFKGFNWSGFDEEQAKDTVFIRFLSFDKNKHDFNEYAISINDTSGMYWANTVYFFKGNTTNRSRTLSYLNGVMDVYLR